MSSRVSDHIRSNVYGILALFLVLTGGTAIASHPGGADSISSGDIIDGEVKEADVGQGAVGSTEVKNDSLLAGDIALNTVNSSRIENSSLAGIDVQDNSLTGQDVNEETFARAILQRRVGGSCPAGQAIRAVGDRGSVVCQTLTGSAPLGPAGGDLAGDYPDPRIRSNAVGTGKVADDALTGVDISEDSLGRVPSAVLGGFGRSATNGFCDPETGAFVTCAATEVIEVPPGAAALVLGHVKGSVDANANLGIGDCRLGTSSIGEVPNTTLTFKVHPDDGDNSGLFGITPALPAGPTSFGIDCQDSLNNGTTGGISYFNATAGVVLITDR